MSRIITTLILFLGLTLSFQHLFGQGQLAVGSTFEDYLRREQLLGKYDTISTFMLRPIDLNVPDTSLFKSIALGNYGKLTLLPISFQSKYADKHPYGWNDGSMLPLRGYQQLISAGIGAKFGPLNIQIAPEYHYAQNLYFEGFPLSAGNILWTRYFARHLNYIDKPETFGNEQIEAFYLGQSSIKLDFGPLSIGWSNQNLWWGPGKRNSLVMSNNPRGFQHLTFNTRRPIKTPVGHFEFQVLSGRLEESGVDPPNAFFNVNGSYVFNERNPDWRYLSGFTFNYSPKWVPGLSVGTSRVVQQYYETAKENSDYLAAFSNLFRSNDAFNDIVRDQLGSFFIRYFSTQINSEFYFEFARNDAAFDFRDLFLEPNHSAGYLFGVTKLFPFKQRKKQFIEANFEWTILRQSSSRIIRNAFPNFYGHSRIRHGYTHRGEVLGAGIGPSSNSQTLEVKWVNNYNKIGLRLERYTHNEDLYIDLFQDIQDWLRPWVDFNTAVTAAWQFDQLILEAEVSYIKSFNYQYQIYRFTPTYFPSHVDLNNFTVGLNLHFMF